MKASRTILLVFLTQFFFLSTINAQKLGRGFCPRTQIVQDFNATQYLGKWFEIERIPSPFRSGECTEANYGPVNKWGQIEVLNKEIQNRQIVGIRGVATQSKMHHGDLQVSLILPIVGAQRSGYDVLATDYDNYAVVHTCRQLGRGRFKLEFGWILSRSRTLTSEQSEEVKRVIVKNGVDPQHFVTTKQENCPDIDNYPYRLLA